MSRRLVLAVCLAVPAVGAMLGCYRDRERLDVPVLHLFVEADSVSPGDTIRGILQASDASGLLLVRLLAVYRRDAQTPFVDTLRLRYDLPELTEVTLPFAVPIPDVVPIGSRVALVAAAFDDQEFLVEATDTLWVVP
ncbi:MAG TPA: hypothetical protein VK922_11435 [Gemmatimonadaceae bacterium]|nr:hypothetical protein [Gemmatimonadaceae bacterium]